MDLAKAHRPAGGKEPGRQSTVWSDPFPRQRS